MAQPANGDVRSELRTAISRDPTVLGKVFPLSERGLSDRGIADQLGRANPGFVSNNRTHIRAILDGAIPKGPTMAAQTAGVVRRISSSGGLSGAAQAHLRAVLAELAAAGGQPGSPRRRAQSASEVAPPAPENGAGGNLRNQVDAALRGRTADLIQRIRVETSLHADDYARVLSASFALDAIVRLVADQATSRTTQTLHAVRRLDLSIEQATVEWAVELPIPTDLVEAARGRLGYWGST